MSWVLSKFCDVIRRDLMQMLHNLQSRTSLLFSLNFGVTTLIPKVQEANRIQLDQPICLLNVSFKIVTKLANIWINTIVDYIVGPTRRNILEEVFIMHETIQFMSYSSTRYPLSNGGCFPWAVCSGL